MDRPPTSDIQETLRSIRPLSVSSDAAAARPELGELGRLGERLGRVFRGRDVRSPLGKLLFIAAADHGAARREAPAAPRKSTAECVRDLLAGRAVLSMIAARSKTRTVVADFGLKEEVEPPEGCPVEFVGAKPLSDGGTEDITRCAPMPRPLALASVRAGVDAMKRASSAGDVDLVGLGAAGTGGEIAACAIAAVLTGKPVRDLTGRATKRSAALAAAVQEALERPSPDPSDAVGVLSEYGRLEIGGLVGACLAAAGLGLPVVLDGAVSAAAACVALDLAPAARGYFLASDRAALPAHGELLEYLGLAPLLALGLDMGEGEGVAAALAMELADVAWDLAGPGRQPARRA